MVQRFRAPDAAGPGSVQALSLATLVYSQLVCLPPVWDFFSPVMFNLIICFPSCLSGIPVN